MPRQILLWKQTLTFVKNLIFRCLFNKCVSSFLKSKSLYLQQWPSDVNCPVKCLQPLLVIWFQQHLGWTMRKMIPSGVESLAKGNRVHDQSMSQSLLTEAKLLFGLPTIYADCHFSLRAGPGPHPSVLLSCSKLSLGGIFLTVFRGPSWCQHWIKVCWRLYKCLTQYTFCILIFNSRNVNGWEVDWKTFFFFLP